jgi:hypothetical protein
MTPRIARWSSRATPLIALLTLVAVMAAAKMRSEAAPAMLALGAQLLRDERRGPEDGRVLLLNGLPLRVETGATTQGMAEVLGGFEHSCLEGHAADTLRGGDDTQGFVACALPATEDHDLAARLRLLAAGDVGAIRYVYAARRRGVTSFVRIWSDTPISLPRLLPESGDAPGEDIETIFRPPGSRRLLSMQEMGYPYRANLYEGSPLVPAKLAEYYRGALAGAGWRGISPTPQCEERCRLVAERDGRMVILLIKRQPRGSQTMVLASGPDEERRP